MFREVLRLILCSILLLSKPVHLRLCARAMDVVFMLDCDPDVSNDNWYMMMTLARDAAYQLRGSAFGSHIAQVQFSSNASVVHGLDTELRVNLHRYHSFPPGRNLSDAIETTRRSVLNNIGGDRPEVPDVIVLITHGLSDDENSARMAATRLKSDGIGIVTVGITSRQVDELREQLQYISTEPGDVDNLMILSRNYYPSVLTALVYTMCRNRVEAENGSLRLVDGTSHTGRLEVYVNEEWTTVCSTGWTHVNTKLACKQLGFPDGQRMYTTNQTLYHRRVALANVQCSGNETNLLKCSHDFSFHVQPNCNHRQDVFLRCLCGDCNDYTQKDSVRLNDRTSMSGRLEILSPGRGWGGVCSAGWTASNSRVACRQLGFSNGAGTYQKNHSLFDNLALFSVRCSGNETSLFDCNYTATSEKACGDPIYIQCECHICSVNVFSQVPQQKYATTYSTVLFEWYLNYNISAFEVVFLTQKNPQLLVHVEGSKVAEKHTRFKNRIQSINVNYKKIGFQLSNITVADMGIYSLQLPELLLHSKTILIVTDFAVVPDPVMHRKVNDRVLLSWDLSALQPLHHISHEILLTTPATGRLNLDYYYNYWLKDNAPRHGVPRRTDSLHPTVVIDNLSANDAGNYSVEVGLILTSSVHHWLYAASQFTIYLEITDSSHYSPTISSAPAPIAAIVIAVLLGISILSIIALIYTSRKKRQKELEVSELQQRLQSIMDLRQRIQQPREPPAARINQVDDYEDGDQYQEGEQPIVTDIY